MEIINDTDLFRATRTEVLQALVTNPVSGKRTFDIRKLASLPLIQSIYTESLRLHLSLNLTRTATEDIAIAGFTLPKGCTVQAPTQISHYEEAVWGTPDHRASEFWAYRHVKPSKAQDREAHFGNMLEYSISGHTGSFFPYGKFSFQSTCAIPTSSPCSQMLWNRWWRIYVPGAEPCEARDFASDSNGCRKV